MATFRNAQTAQTGDGWTNMSITKPTGLTVGDVMLAGIIHTSNSSNSWAAITPPTGWTVLQDVNAGTSRYNRLIVWWKTATSGDVAASTFTFTASGSPSSYDSSGIVAAWAVANSSTPINVSTQIYNSTASNNISSAATTTSVANSRLAVFFSGGAGTGTVTTMTPPGTMTERAEVTSTGGPYGNLMLADEQFAAAGTYTRTATYDSSVSAGSLVIAVGLDDTGASVTVSSVDGDDIIRSNQANVVATGSGFGATQGTGSITLRQGTTSVTQSIDSWATTSVQFDTIILQTGPDIKHGSATLRATANGGAFGERAITVQPPTGQLYVDLTSVAADATTRITAFPDLSIGDQLWARGPGDTAAPTGLVLNPDATFYFTAGNNPAIFEVAVWDASDSTWGAWSEFSYLTGVVGTSAVGTVDANPTTIVIVTGLVGTSALTSVFPGLDTVVTGLAATGNVGTVNIGTNALVEVEGVEAIGQIAKLNLWSSIISSQPNPNWVVIIT